VDFLSGSQGRSPGTAMAWASRLAAAPKPKNKKAASSTPRQIKAFVLPAFDPTNHLLYFSSEPGQIHGCAIGTVAMRTAAIHDEQGNVRVAAQVPLVDPAVRQIDGTGHVSGLERLWAPHIEQHEIVVPILHRFMHIPAVGFKRQELLKVIEGGLRIGGDLSVCVHTPLSPESKSLSIGRNANMQ
jgi:hypothetical protein